MSPPLQPGGPVPADDSQNTYRLSKESPIAPEGIQPPPPVKRYAPRREARPTSSNFFALLGFDLLVFVTSICVMTLELTASRLIGKHVGSSLYTWTSVIGVVLAGITLGNWFGGWMADRYDRARALSWIYLLASISCGSVLWLDQLVGTIPRPDSFSWPAWVVTVVGGIFLLPALTLGATSPLVASMALQQSAKVGSTVGNVYAWGAFGSIVGTFLTGFYLIDVWGTRSIISFTAITLAILALIVAGSRRVFRAGVVLGWLQLLGWMTLIATSNAEAFSDVGYSVGRGISAIHFEQDSSTTSTRWSDFGRKLGTRFHEFGLFLRMRDDALNEFHDESNYYDITIDDVEMNGKKIKSLRLDKLIHSYYDPNDPTSLHYEYEKVYAAVTKKSASLATAQSLTLKIEGIDSPTISTEKLPDGVSLNETDHSLTISQSTTQVFDQLLSMAPESPYWRAIDYLHSETNKSNWGGFSSVNLSRLPDGVTIPIEFAERLRHDESLEVLVAYQPISASDRDKLVAETPAAQWYRNVESLRRESRQASACFYGGGGYIFPRWFLKEFPGSNRIDIAELDPAVHRAVTQEMGLTPALEERIHTTIGDARNFVDDQLRENILRGKSGKPTIAYDFIYADAFNDFSIPWHLTTVEFLQKTHDLLSDHGVFQANIIDVYPRTEFPGTTVGEVELEYAGRLPNGIISVDARRDRFVPAATAFAPLEVMELLTNQYRLRVSRTITGAEERRFLDVSWPPVPAPKDYDVSKGVQPEIDVTVERKNWEKAVSDLATRSQKKLGFRGTIPDQLGVSEMPIDGWISCPSPFEFVEIYRIDSGRNILGFRGLVTEKAANELIQLDPQNTDWVNAVTTAASRSQANRLGRFMGRYVATAAKVFPNIYVFSTSHRQPDTDRDTFVMVCSRQPLDLKSLDATGDWTGGPFASLQSNPDQSDPILEGQMAPLLALSDGQILTDDFAPVDNLLVPIFMSQE